MSTFAGQMYRGDEPPQRAHLQIEEGRARLFTDRRRIASWDLEELQAERTGVYRFRITAGDFTFDFQPTDPAGFAEEVGAVVDLRVTKSRFGLAERVRAATGQG
ncbi:MAG TPA: hypothetical protein VLA54_01495 [Acidimicrobiia bacterium]|nr:hypothetical protein [Acidimicrobiia bacterium]